MNLHPRPCDARTILVLLVTLVAAACPSTASGQAEPAEEARPAWLIRVPLPINESVSAQVRQQIARVAGEAPSVVAADRRPVLILEFDTTNSATGQGSAFGSCLDIAMLLTDARLKGMHTVAYVPAARGVQVDSDDALPASRLEGHAVLVAVACSEIAMHDESAIGNAGSDVQPGSTLEFLTYREIGGRRLPLPLALTMGMVDSSVALYQVNTDSGLTFADQNELERMESEGVVVDSKTLSSAGELPIFTSRELQEMQAIRKRVTSRNDLAARLDIDPQSIEGDPAAGGKWVAAQLPLGNAIDAQEADWSLRMLHNHLKAQPDTNLLIVRLNSPGGEIDACLQIARALAELDPARVRTVAFVESQAAGASSLIAMACDQVIVTEQAIIGGENIFEEEATALEDSRPLIRMVAETAGRSWSVPLGLVDPELEVIKFRNRATGEIRLLSEEERQTLPDADQWDSVDTVDLSAEVSAKLALDLGLARSRVADFDQLLKFFQLSAAPMELEPSRADRWIEGLARWMASPQIAFWLLFGAVFLLSTEMSSPGLGVPGLLGSVCLVLFFWSQHLDGNASWLEILLFLLGVAFLLLEVFVLPGFGIFGISGLLLLVISIVLASQTFVFPGNSEEYRTFSMSLVMVLAASGGFLTALIVFRRYIGSLPFLRRLMLSPPGADTAISPTQRESRESSARRAHLMGRQGTATTRLAPSGKALFGNELVDVITDGRMIDRGQPVRVVEVSGNRVQVEERMDEGSV